MSDVEFTSDDPLADPTICPTMGGRFTASGKNKACQPFITIANVKYGTANHSHRKGCATFLAGGILQGDVVMMGNKTHKRSMAMVKHCWDNLCFNFHENDANLSQTGRLRLK